MSGDRAATGREPYHGGPGTRQLGPVNLGDMRAPGAGAGADVRQSRVRDTHRGGPPPAPGPRGAGRRHRPRRPPVRPRAGNGTGRRTTSRRLTGRPERTRLWVTAAATAAGWRPGGDRRPQTGAAHGRGRRPRRRGPRPTVRARSFHCGRSSSAPSRGSLSGRVAWAGHRLRPPAAQLALGPGGRPISVARRENSARAWARCRRCRPGRGREDSRPRPAGG